MKRENKEKENMKENNNNEKRNIEKENIIWTEKKSNRITAIKKRKCISNIMEKYKNIDNKQIQDMNWLGRNRD